MLRFLNRNLQAGSCVRAGHCAGFSWQQPWEGLGMLISALITFVVIILVLYLINLLPLDGRAKQIARVVVIIIGIVSLLRLIQVI